MFDRWSRGLRNHVFPNLYFLSGDLPVSLELVHRFLGQHLDQKSAAEAAEDLLMVHDLAHLK